MPSCSVAGMATLWATATTMQWFGLPYWAAIIAGSVATVVSSAMAPALVYGKGHELHHSATPPTNGGTWLQQAARRVGGWTVPKHWFRHFYWLASTHAALCLLWLWHTCGWSGTAVWHDDFARPAALLLAPFLLHALRRVGECHFVHRFSATARMTWQVYLAGMAFYAFVPWTLMPAPVLVPHAHTIRRHMPTPSWLVWGVAAAGCALFLSGMAVQAWAHASLAALRPMPIDNSRMEAVATPGTTTAVRQLASATKRARGRSRTPDRVVPSSRSATSAHGGGPPLAAAYPLPTGTVFAISWSPHYTGEVMLYTGLCFLHAAVNPSSLLHLICHGGVWSPAGGGMGAGLTITAAHWLAAGLPWAMWAMVVCNLAATAAQTRAYYERQHPDHGPRIRATARMLPGLW